MYDCECSAPTKHWQSSPVHVVCEQRDQARLSWFSFSFFIPLFPCSLSSLPPPPFYFFSLPLLLSEASGLNISCLISAEMNFIVLYANRPYWAHCWGGGREEWDRTKPNKQNPTAVHRSQQFGRCLHYIYLT